MNASPSPLFRIARFASLAVLAWWTGCTGEAYIGGRCGETDDCHTEMNNIPGSFCADNNCECIAGEDKCCPGGDLANCKLQGEYRCRPYTECHPAPPACVTAADCVQPVEPRCATAVCKAGVCEMKFTPLTKLDSQLAGDCQSEWCDGAGNVVAIPDGGDVYNDGRRCTIDTCEKGVAKNTPHKDGSLCPESGSGVCYDGECVECLKDDSCPGLVCDFIYCNPFHCDNSIADGNFGETGLDCGGPCKPCTAGLGCKADKDCKDGNCEDGMCQLPTCSDGVKNNGETGIDCGAPSCLLKCGDGGGCKVASDCQSGVCWAGVCIAPACNDGVSNGDEVKVDCGGPCPACP